MSNKNFIKLGEELSINASNIQSVESVFSDPSVDERFKKFAGDLRRITPKADDFLYFSAVMLHSAEAALVNTDGTMRVTAKGEPIEAHWDKKGDSWKWVCNDNNVRPYRNSNGDIFPESELLKAHSKWCGRPLCIDHKSSSVDAIRGIILDTYYDRQYKRVIGLCALDKVSYPELARGVQTGYKTSVSMGTSVEMAICTDCGTAAKTEADFCNHMRNRTCYGEINVGLNPIELSIVVNGADPQAKIRTIIAAAREVQEKISQEEKEIKLSTNLVADHLSKMSRLEDASKKLAEIKEMLENEVDSAPYGQSSGRLETPSDEIDQNETELNLPERLASVGNNDASVSEVSVLLASLAERIQKMEKILSNNKEETTNMAKDTSMKSEAYYQGGGGVNEPTPGQAKYPVDPKNEKLRSEDKHMVGEGPFPGVGNVDGLHPSPASAEQKDELERKKMLARAEQEERSMRRAAALKSAKEKLGYYQGGGGVNEPTPNKQKYPVDGLQDKLREKEDKQMVGQKPFPGVGDVEGLHPSPLSADQKDELARKKLLQRASLKAKFVRVANVDGTDNLGDSAWQIYAKDESGEKLVFTASVNDITGGRSDALFDVVATKDFGSKMLEKIRSVGLTKAASVFKKGQALAGPAATPGVSADQGGAGAVPAMPDMGAPAGGPVDAAPVDASKPEDEGGKGDPKETAMKLSEKVRDLSSNLLEVVRNLTGEKSQMGDMEEGLEAMPKAASEVLTPLYSMRKNLHSALLQSAKKALADLRDHKEELELVASVIGSDTNMNKDYINTVIQESFTDASATIADAAGVKEAFLEYSRGTAGLMKRAAEVQSSLFATADDVNDARKAKKKSEKEETKEEKEEKESAKEEEEEDKSDADDNFGFDFLSDTAAPEGDDALPEMDLNVGEEDADLNHDLVGHDDALADEDLAVDDINDTMVDLPSGTPVPPGAKAVDTKVAFNLTTKAGRSAYRAKLAADATGKEEEGEIMDEASLPKSDLLDEADKLADGQTELDVKPSDDLGKIETPEEQHKKDMEVAKAEPKVRKEAERLNQLISEGKVSESELDGLVAQGLDGEVVKYWKAYYGQAGKEGSEFAKLLTTETMKANAATEIANHKVKIARAYELTNEMVRKGLCEDDRSAITAQVEEIMSWNDEGFASLKRLVAKTPLASTVKTASRMPQVTGSRSDDMYSEQSDVGNFQSELDNAFSGRKY